MLGDRRLVAASSPMHRMRSYRLLRYFAKSARIETQRSYRPSDRHEFRGRRAVVLRLSNWGILCRSELAPAAFAPIRSTGARTSRTSTCKLANAAPRVNLSPKGSAYSAASTLWIWATTAAPSPTAAATRLVDPDLTSPMAKTPTRLVSSGNAGCPAR
jgi:hypothetical protein